MVRMSRMNADENHVLCEHETNYSLDEINNMKSLHINLNDVA